MACPHPPLRLGVVLIALALVSSGCAAQNEPDRGPGQADQSAQTSASDASQGGADTRDEPEPQGAEPITGEEDGIAARSDVPQTGPEDSVTVDPGPTLPEGKAAHHCEGDEDCLGCAGEGTCQEGTCVYVSEGCVIADLEGDLATCYADNAPAPTSDCLHCRASVAPDRWSGVWVAASFEESLSPFIWVETLGEKEATWHVSEVRSQDGIMSARFGTPESDTYASSGRSWGRIKTERLYGEAGVVGSLTFWLWLETEQTPGYDILSVKLLTPGKEEVLWDSESIGGTTEGEWRRITLEVAAPPKVDTYIAIEFDSVDGIINGYEGPFIDGLMLSTNCCLADADCVTGNVCLTGSCGSEGTCDWMPVFDCCYEADHCPQTEPCLRPTCSGPGGTCGSEPIENCCMVASDCDDEDPCTQEICAFPGALCENRPLCCGHSLQCISDDPCFKGTCEGNECVYVDRCCESDLDCDDGDPCTTATCFDQLCLSSVLPIEGCCVQEVFTEDFDSGLSLAGWSFQGIVGGVGWAVVAPPQVALPSPPAGLYYGNPSSWSYNSGGANDGKVWTPFLMLPIESEITLSFDLFMDVQAQQGVDTFTVLIHGPSGWEEVIEKPDVLVGQWHEVSLDVSSLAGYAVQLAFEFRTVDAQQKSGLGVFIDNLELKTTCAQRACSADEDCPSTDSCIVGACSTEGACVYSDICCNSDTECDDGNPCTLDSCVYQHCEHEVQTACCADASDCDDGDPCTLDVCSGPGGACFFPEIDGCCASSAECDDADPCTTDQCLENVCAHVSACCTNDVDCDDGDDICTTDECVEGYCVYAPTGLSGCCLNAPVTWDFESPLSFEMAATSPPCSWQIVDTGKSSSGAISMYYGDTESMTFACGHNAGTATSPEITLIGGVAYTLIFDANIDVESNTVYDTLDVYALVEDKEVLLWDKSLMISTDTWHTYAVDLSAMAGRTFRLRFSFDTHDDVANESSGLYIDDIQITSTCLPKPCLDDPGCDDGVSQTLDSCGLNGCEYLIQ